MRLAQNPFARQHDIAVDARVEVGKRQRNVRVGPLEGGLRGIEEGLKADDRVITAGLLRASPGQKVDPQLKTVEAQPASAK